MRLSRRSLIPIALSAPLGLATAQTRINSRLFSFVAGRAGPWSIIRAKAVTGEPLPLAERLDLAAGAADPAPAGTAWVLRGVTSNERYVTREEKAQLVARQAPLGRAQATRAALIPIRKKAEWWALPQDDRRKILEETSHHTRIGMAYLPAIARRLHHCRDLATPEPFDFLTWFDFAPEDAAAFEDLVGKLRETEEWKFVDREIDFRLAR